MAAPPQTKKRKAREEEDVTFVELPREQLLTMSSGQLEENIRHLNSIRSFTGAEQREIKRQRRLIKNREYAQTSRVKKKQFVEELRQENDLLRERLRLLEEENHFLRFGGGSNGTPFPQPTSYAPLVQQHMEPTYVMVSPAPQPTRTFVQTYPSNNYQRPPHDNCHMEVYYTNQQQQSYSSCTSPSSLSYSAPESPEHQSVSNLATSSSGSDLSSEDMEVLDSSDPTEEFLFPRLETEQPPATQFDMTFASSLCFMIVLFSFAFFLPSFLPLGSSPAPIQFTAQPMIFGESQSQDFFRTSRSLLSTDPLMETGTTNVSANSSLIVEPMRLSIDDVLKEECCLTQTRGSGLQARGMVPLAACA